MFLVRVPETLPMDRNPFEFRRLSQAQLDSYISRAQQARAEAIADAFIWLGRLLHRLLIKPFSGARPSHGRRTPPRGALPR